MIDDAAEQKDGRNTTAIVAVVVVLVLLSGGGIIAAMVIWKRSLKQAEMQRNASRRPQIEHATHGIAETRFDSDTGPLAPSTLVNGGGRSASFKIPPPPPGQPPVQRRGKKDSDREAHDREAKFPAQVPRQSSTESASSTRSNRSTAYIYDAGQGPEVVYSLAQATTERTAMIHEASDEFGVVGVALSNVAETSTGTVFETRPTARGRPVTQVLRVADGQRESHTETAGHSVSFDSSALDIDTDAGTIAIDAGASSADIDVDATGVITIDSAGGLNDVTTDELQLTTGGLRPGEFDT